MNIKPFSGPGSTPARRRFWSEVRAAVLSQAKLAGRHVTVDEHPGKGSVINVQRRRGPQPAYPGPMPTLYCDFRNVHLTKHATFPPLLSAAQCIGQYLTRTATLSWHANYHLDHYPNPGDGALDITKTTSGTEMVTLDTDGNILTMSHTGTSSVTRTDGNHTCSATLVEDTVTTNVCIPSYQTLYPLGWYRSYFHGTQQDPPFPATNHASCIGCSGGGGINPAFSCTGPGTVNNSYYGTYMSGICVSTFYDGWQNGTCQKSDSGTVSGGNWTNDWNWTIEHSDEYTTDMFIQKAKDALAATAYLDHWRCRLAELDCREPNYPCTYAPYTADDACGCNGYINLFDDDLQINLAQFRYYLRVNDSDPVPPAGTTLLWDEESTYDDSSVTDDPKTFTFDGTSRETDIFETPILDENSTTIIANVRWQ